METYLFDDKSNDDYVFIDGVSNSNRNDLAILFLKNNISLMRGSQGRIGYDKNNIFEKTMINGGWNVPLDKYHEVKRLREIGYSTEEALKIAKIYGNGIGCFIVPYGKKGFINVKGEQVDISVSDDDNNKRTQNKIDNYFAVYKLTPIGVEFFAEKRNRNEKVKASTYYEWDGDDLDDVSIGSAKIVDTITPITNSIVDEPAFTTDANNISCNSLDDEKKNIDNNKISVKKDKINMIDQVKVDNNSATNGCSTSSNDNGNIDMVTKIELLVQKVEELTNSLKKTNTSTNEGDDKNKNDGKNTNQSTNEDGIDDLKMIIAELSKKVDDLIAKLDKQPSTNETDDKEDKEKSKEKSMKGNDNTEQSVNSIDCGSIVVSYNL